MIENPVSCWIALAALILLPACSTINIVADGDDARLMLRGNDPVAYDTMVKAVQGDLRIK